ncbi:MAG: response regulator transcription factor [Defluviitaleaceae bacterium]|nr:response regulator transcription factor [Defluviitaleaceae bacterium]MCL2263905.1 response regulator transcription factor [Defluviitaleaceae bacterium]
MGTVLLVEDNKKILEANRWILQERGHTVLCAETLAEARAVLASKTPDIAVFDIMLPDGDGITFLPEFRKTCNIPVLFLTSLTSQEEVIQGLRAGSNDYITKPYKIDEFCARVEAAMQWEISRRNSLKFTRGSFTLDLLAGQACANEEPLPLTGTEFKLLYLCLQNEGKIMEFEFIYENIWQRPMGTDKNAVQAAIKRFRQKIEPVGYDIYAVRNKGYIFDVA